MEGFFNLDWESIFLPQTPLLEIFIRGTVTYLTLFVLLRVILKRESGMVGITDMLLVVLLAEAAQNALTDDYRSIPDGILLVLTIIFWSYTLNWLGYRFPLIGRMVHPPPLLLVKDGEMIKRNMRKEFITEDELMSMLRQQGINDVAQAAEVHMEGDGQISVVTTEKEQHSPPEKKAR
jgi:uncharacterized membrane protein YcaP (DUF421 family)